MPPYAPGLMNPNIYQPDIADKTTDKINDVMVLQVDSFAGTYQWGFLNIVGAKPCPRYGHSMTFLSPYLVIFGGCEG